VWGDRWYGRASQGRATSAGTGKVCDLVAKERVQRVCESPVVNFANSCLVSALLNDFGGYVRWGARRGMDGDFGTSSVNVV